jgi:hypothetical protein
VLPAGFLIPVLLSSEFSPKPARMLSLGDTVGKVLKLKGGTFAPNGFCRQLDQKRLTCPAESRRGISMRRISLDKPEFATVLLSLHMGPGIEQCLSFPSNVIQKEITPWN